MTLHQVDPDVVIADCKEHPHKKHLPQGRQSFHRPSYRRDEDAALIPKYTIPLHGISSRAAYQLLHDETHLDGNPTLNLAS